jgi:hypothetical protein
MAERKADLTRRAGLGPWTQLGGRTQRLQLLSRMGRDEEVLAEVAALRAQMAALPEQSDQEEQVIPWNVREIVLDTGRYAARNLERWEEALMVNAEQVRSKQARGATAHDVAWTRFNDYFPLLRLGEVDEAERLLLACRDVFEAEGDLARLGKTLGALADLEAERDHSGEAIRLQQTALRYSYAVPDPEMIGISHHNLASYLGQSGRDVALVVAHRLAAALIRARTGSGELPSTLEALARDLADAGDPAPLPGSFAELCAQLEQVEGVRLAELAAQLPQRQANDHQVLAELIQLARTPPGVRQQVMAWVPVLDLVVAAAGGNQDAATTKLEPFLAEQAKNPDWTALVGVLRRILAGERSDDLTQGLDPVDTAIVTQTLRRLAVE